MGSSIILIVLLAAALPFEVVAQKGFGGFGSGVGFGGFASCASSCANTFGSSCTWTDGGDCFCKNSTLIADVNSCVASSSCSTSNKDDVYSKISSLCATTGNTITAAPEATFTATSSAWPSRRTSGAGPFGAGGSGPFGSGWGPWGSSGSWTSGAWTNWWGDSGCPDSTWTGWTSGSWDKSAPWTSWTACSATTTATVSFRTTTTLSGGGTSVIIGTTFGVKVAQGTASPTTSAPDTGSTLESSASRNCGMVTWTLVLGALGAPFLVVVAVL